MSSAGKVLRARILAAEAVELARSGKAGPATKRLAKAIRLTQDARVIVDCGFLEFLGLAIDEVDGAGSGEGKASELRVALQSLRATGAGDQVGTACEAGNAAVEVPEDQGSDQEGTGREADASVPSGRKHQLVPPTEHLDVGEDADEDRLLEEDRRRRLLRKLEPVVGMSDDVARGRLARLEELEAVGFERSRVRFLKACHEYHLRLFERAKTTFSSMPSADADRVEVLNPWARAAMRIGTEESLVEAIGLLRRSLELDRDQPRMRLELGRIHLLRFHRRSRESACSMIGVGQPEDADLLAAIGVLESGREIRPRKRPEGFGPAGARDHGAAPLGALLGEAYLLAGRSEDAVRTLVPVMEASPPPKSVGHLVEAELRVGAFDDAERWAERLTRESPAFARGWVLLARARLARRDMEGAREALERGVAMEDADGECRILLALGSMSGPIGGSADFDARVAHASELVAAVPVEARGQLWRYASGCVAVRRRRFDEALGFLDVTEMPDAAMESDRIFLIGICRAALGRMAEAIRDFDRVRLLPGLTPAALATIERVRDGAPWDDVIAGLPYPVIPLLAPPIRGAATVMIRF